MPHYFTKPSPVNEEEATAAIKQWAYLLTDRNSLDPLFQRIGEASIVMLGEASQSTCEFGGHLLLMS